MLSALILAALTPATKPVSTTVSLQCFVGEDVEQQRFALLIDRKAHLMTVSSNHFEATTMPVSITPKSIVGRGPIHYNMTGYEIALPELRVRVTTVPHIWPGPTPTLVAEGRCSGDVN